MTEINMPLWFDWLQDDDWWSQLDDPDEDGMNVHPMSWEQRAVNEIIAEEEPNFDEDDTREFPF